MGRYKSNIDILNRYVVHLLLVLSSKDEKSIAFSVVLSTSNLHFIDLILVVII